MVQIFGQKLGEILSFDNFGGGEKGSEGVHTLGQKFVLFLDDLNKGSVLEIIVSGPMIGFYEIYIWDF